MSPLREGILAPRGGEDVKYGIPHLEGLGGALARE